MIASDSDLLEQPCSYEIENNQQQQQDSSSNSTARASGLGVSMIQMQKKHPQDTWTMWFEIDTKTKWGRKHLRSKKKATREDTIDIVKEDDSKSIYRPPPEEDDLCEMMERLELEKKTPAPLRYTPADIALRAVLDSLT